MAAAGHRRGHPARRLLHPARNPDAAHRRPARSRRADGGGHRLQPRLLADDLADPGDEHGLHPVPHDPAGGAAGHHRPRRPRPWPDRPRHASPPASAPIWRSGTPTTRPNWPTASAPPRFMPASSEAALTPEILIPGATSLAQLERIYRSEGPARLDAIGPRRRRGRRRPHRRRRRRGTRGLRRQHRLWQTCQPQDRRQRIPPRCSAT